MCSRWYNFDNYKTDISLVIGDKPTPKHSIDRIDNNKGYEPENIRWATRSQQLYNQRLRIDNKSGIKGVRWDTKDNKWFAYFNFNKKMIFLGRFDDKDKAIEARRIAELEAVL